MRRVHIVTFARDGAARAFTLRRSLIVLSASLTLALIAWAGFSLYLVLFRDTLVGKLLADQEQMRAAYEEKLASQRLKLDEAARQQTTAQDNLDGRLRELISRQAQLEGRTETVARLLRGGNIDLSAARALPGAAGAATLPSAEGQTLAVAKSQPTDPLKAIADFSGQKPRPIDDMSLSSYVQETPSGEATLSPPSPQTLPPTQAPSHSRQLGPRASLFDGPARDYPLGLAGSLSIESVANSLDSIERLQVETLRSANSRATVALDKIRGALRISGLDPARFTHVAVKRTPDVGGPFMPLTKEAKEAAASSPSFDALLNVLKARLEEHDELSHAILTLPVRQPFPGQLAITSPFGPRKDPFGMGWALHPGLDLQAQEGSIVRATAPGKVTNASWAGGYGNMVEIQHAEGVSTRYGHLSAILVSEGQVVAAGTPIGRVGSTGRSTGPHLHYETRIDGEPVDPMRFLRSSNVLLAATGGVD
jgi:murein DD-endopeptidase MepM/ murein hydrolase activator NlpD